jgi:predicted amidohydrolase
MRADVVRTLRVGMGQTLVVPGEPDANVARAAAMVEEAADEGCDVVVLPECGDHGWTSAAAAEVTEHSFTATVERYRALASEHRIAIVAGLTERSGPGVFNTAIAIEGDGSLVGRHRKVNELDFARMTYATGTGLQAVPALGTAIGISICADNSAGSNYIPETLCALGARIILSPCAWAVPPGFDQRATPYGDEWVRPYTEVAKRWGVPVVGVSYVGPVVDGDWAGWSCIGCSIAVDREGVLVAQLGYGESELGVVDLLVGP